MRISIDIDEELLAEVTRRLGSKSRKAVVEEALRRVLQIERQKDIRELRGTVEWYGDLDSWRRDGDDSPTDLGDH